MQEKVGWAARSLERMKQARRDNNTIDVQDHFWAYLHAAHLVWFYFSQWAKQSPRHSETTKTRVRKWEQSLSYAERTTWSALTSLRNEDVHVQPVSTSRHGAIAVDGGAIVVQEGAVVVVVSYRVYHDGRQLDAFQLCEDGLPVLNRFIAAFPSQ